MTKHPFQATAFTAEPAFHSMPDPAGGERATWFVLDLDSLNVPKNPCVVDYNHDQTEPIGYAILSVENGALMAKGEFCSYKENDRAFQLASIGADVPFGISPTLSFESATGEEIPENQTGEANGRVYAGPLVIYRGVTVLGVSVCPYPTDSSTSMTPLKQSGVIKLFNNGAFTMANELETPEKPIPVDDKTAEANLAAQTGDETGVQDGVQQVRDAELQSFIDEFGLEKGVGFFQRSLSLDDARMEDYGELKRLASESAPPPEKPKEEKDETATLAADSKILAGLQATNKAINSLVALLSRNVPNLGRIGAPSVPKTEAAPAAPPKKTYADSVLLAAGVRGV